MPHLNDSDSSTSDESLMRRFQAGEDEAFQALFNRYSSHLINFAYRFLSSREASEDVAQETFLRVYRGKDRYDATRPFRPWLFSIAVRLASNRLRDQKRHPRVALEGEQDEDGDRQALDLSDTSPLPHAELERRHLAERVKEALKVLPETQRTAVLLARFEGLSYAEIAEAMGTSVTAVKLLLFRARQTLKKVLTPYVEEEDDVQAKEE